MTEFLSNEEFEGMLDQYKVVRNSTWQGYEWSFKNPVLNSSLSSSDEPKARKGTGIKLDSRLQELFSKDPFFKELSQSWRSKKYDEADIYQKMAKFTRNYEKFLGSLTLQASEKLLQTLD